MDLHLENLLVLLKNKYIFNFYKDEESITILGVGVTVSPEICIRNCIVLPYKSLTENCSGITIL